MKQHKHKHTQTFLGTGEIVFTDRLSPYKPTQLSLQVTPWYSFDKVEPLQSSS